MTERAHDRLSRLLGLLPYLTHNPGSELHEVARHFGVREEQIVDDLELLFVTGRPGHMPDDLIEAEWESGRVYVGNADEVSVPVRLARHEVGGLLLALNYLASAHEVDPATIDGIRTKLLAAAGREPGSGTGPTLHSDPPSIPHRLAQTLRTAMETGSALTITYYVPTRDELTERTILPRRRRLGRVWYLDAVCLSSGGERSFAMDRIRSASLTEVPQGAQHTTVPEAPEQSQSDAAGLERGLRVTLAPHHAWLADEIDVESAGGVRTDDVAGPGTVELDLPTVGGDWAVRLLTAHGRGVTAAQPYQTVRHAADVTDAALALYDLHGSGH